MGNASPKVHDTHQAAAAHSKTQAPCIAFPVITPRLTTSAIPPITSKKRPVPRQITEPGVEKQSL